MNLLDVCVEVHREPEPVTGSYRAVRSYGRGERLIALVVAGLDLRVDDILG